LKNLQSEKLYLSIFLDSDLAIFFGPLSIDETSKRDEADKHVRGDKGLAFLETFWAIAKKSLAEGINKL
jgi:hypothetical protein